MEGHTEKSHILDALLDPDDVGSELTKFLHFDDLARLTRVDKTRANMGRAILGSCERVTDDGRSCFMVLAKPWPEKCNTFCSSRCPYEVTDILIDAETLVKGNMYLRITEADFLPTFYTASDLAKDVRGIKGEVVRLSDSRLRPGLMSYTFIGNGLYQDVTNGTTHRRAQVVAMYCSAHEKVIESVFAITGTVYPPITNFSVKTVDLLSRTGETIFTNVQVEMVDAQVWVLRAFASPILKP